MYKVTPVVLSIALCSVASAESLRGVIDATNSKVHSALMKKDARAFQNALRPVATRDFKYVEGGKTMTFSEMCKNTEMSMAMMPKITNAYSAILKCKESGDTGTATMRHTMIGTMIGSDKKTHVLNMVAMSNYTFIKLRGKWLMSSMTWGDTSMKMDGKPFNPAKVSG